MTIGIVLASTPGYSETFFTNKIKGLEARGYKVILFVNSTNEHTLLNSKIIIAPHISGNFISVLLKCGYYLIKSLVFSFSATKKLFLLDKKDKLPFNKRIRSIIINSHILPEKLNWLHFGFGTLALDRENVAAAVGAKMAVSFRGFDIGIYPVKNPDCFTKVWNNVNKIHVVSNDIAGLVISNGFQSIEKIIKICPAIDTRYFMPDGFHDNKLKLKFVTIARLNWKKGLEYTLEALALVKERGGDFNYTIIGEGQEKERLKFAAHQLGLAHDVIFAGRLSSEDVKKELGKADIYLQYSIQEGFCNAVLEAQAMGKICIVSDAEGLSENIMDKLTGFVVPKRNPIALANQIIAVTNMSVDEKKIISENATRRVKAQFSLEKQLEQFISFYKN